MSAEPEGGAPTTVAGRMQTYLGAGGFITPYAGDSSGFVSKWQRHLTWVDPRFYWAIGFGADINGFGAQGDPRGAGVSNPVTR